MSVAAEMMPEWKQWEGNIVSGEFSLEQFLGGGEKSAVFRTRLPSGDGAIKLVPAGSVQAEHLVERWSRAAALDHPHLIDIVRTGTSAEHGMPLAYVVTEYAEENLAVVLAERALTAEETLEMLQPVAHALAYLHHRGLAHGSLKPSNIFALKDTLKLSSDAVSPGDASADLRALATTMMYALTQQPVELMEGDAEADVVKSLPEPFQEIARNCIGHNDRRPWSAAQLADWLQSQKGALSTTPETATLVSPARTNRQALGSYAIVFALIAAGAVTVGSLLRNRTPAPPPIASPSAAKPIEPIQGSPPASPPQKEPAVAIKPPAAGEPKARRVVVDAPQEVVRQVVPDIPAQARQTVRGTATVVIGVVVDQSGAVTDAVLEPRGSRYFGRLALEAARQWRFVPGATATPREWSLRFEITRTETTVVPEKLVER